MNKKIFVLIVLLVLLSSFASAGFFSNLWNKITGKAITSQPVTESTILDGVYYISGGSFSADVHITTTSGCSYGGDNNYDPLVKGSITIPGGLRSAISSSFYEGLIGKKSDEICIENRLREYYCDSNGYAHYVPIICKNGCENGACKLPPVKESTDLDEAYSVAYDNVMTTTSGCSYGGDGNYDPLVKGQITVPNNLIPTQLDMGGFVGRTTDETCFAGGVREFYCDKNDYAHYVTVKCVRGCREGACIFEPEKCTTVGERKCIYFDETQGGPAHWLQVCKENMAWTNEKECPHGCENGECIETHVTPCLEGGYGDWSLKAGQCVQVEDKKITFHQAENNKALIEVNGVTATIAEGESRQVNGLEITVKDLADEVGIENDAATLGVRKDIKPPYITINNPKDGSVITADSFLVEVVTDENAVCKYTVGGGIGHGGGVSLPKNMSETGGTEHSQLIDYSFPDGWSGKVSINCTDYSGNSNTNLTHFRIDRTPPQIIINNPKNNSVLAENFVLLDVSTNENAICKYELIGRYIGEQPICETNPIRPQSAIPAPSCPTHPSGFISVTPQEMNTTSGTSHQHLIDLMGEEWVYTITVECLDKPGNANNVSTKFRINITQPYLNESISNESILNESVNHAPVFIATPTIPSTIFEGDSHLFEVQVSDPDGDSVTIGWYFNSDLVSVSDAYNFTAVSGGVLTIIISDGELNNSAEFDIHVATVPPAGGGGGAIPIPDACESGCLHEDVCLPIGTRLEIKGTNMYCSINQKFKKQIAIDSTETCQNNYECLSNECSNRRCIYTYGFLQRIWCLIKSILPGISYEECLLEEFGIGGEQLPSPVAVSAGVGHSCAVLSDGSVKCWGSNNHGQLGDGTTTNSHTPVPALGISNAVGISAGFDSTCALLSDGTVKCWGKNNEGQLGDGTTTDRLTPVNVSGTVVGGNQRIVDIPIAKGLNDSTDGFTNKIDNSDLESFLDTTLNINMNAEDEDYDVHEEIRLGGRPSSGASELIAVETGLSFASSQNEDWKDRVFIPIMRGSIRYYFIFDEALKAANFFTTTNGTFGNTINLPFLGKTLEIASATNTSITVNIGEKYQLKAGDSVEVEGKKVTFHQAGNNKALIEVDGVQEILSENDEAVVNGIELWIQDLLDEEGIEFDAVTIYIGTQARETYKDTDPFIGEDKSDPLWRWNLAKLDSNHPTIGIKWDLNVDSWNEKDNPLIQHPLYQGEQVCLPWEYACIKFDSLKISKYQDYAIAIEPTQGLYDATASDATPIRSSAGVIKINAVGASATGFLAGTTLTDTTEVQADTIYIEANSTDWINLYRKKQNETKAVKFAQVGLNTVGQNHSGYYPFKIYFKDSAFNVYVNLWDGESFNLTFQTEQANDKNITVHFQEESAGKFGFLGHNDSDLTTANDIKWDSSKDLSGWEENTRTVGGIIIKDPKAGASTDRFEFSVPADDKEFKANVIAYIPTKIISITNAVGVSIGSLHACAVLSDGSVMCWGHDAGLTPVQLQGITNAVEVSAGVYKTCILLDNGQINCGEEVPGISNAVGISTVEGPYESHSCAVLSDGGVKCWGRNAGGQLGDGTTADSSAPVSVSGLTNAVGISVSGDSSYSGHSCAVLSDGGVKCWGHNSYGYLGDGTTTNSYTPVSVLGINDTIEVETGFYHTCALLSDGTIKCWGWNYYGELGDGTTTQRNTPVTVLL